MITCLGIAVHLAVACDVYYRVFLCCPFSHEILNLIESVSEGFLPTLKLNMYHCNMAIKVSLECQQ